jgi:hypothetical protein
LNPPDGYNGGPLEKGTIAVVDGTAYFLDRESGYKFVEVDFNTAGIKDAIHVKYGEYVDYSEAAQIQRSFVFAFEGLDIPIGYEGEPGYHGSSKGISSFEPKAPNDYSRCYLHPHFLKGEAAQEFVSLLHELWYAERGKEIMEYLRENYPVTMKDLEAARSQFAPELLLPVTLRPLCKYLPADADKSELAYLVDKIEGMDAEQRGVFNAVTEVGLHCGSVAEIINLTENLNCFGLQPALNETMYGEFQLEQDWSKCEAIIERLQKSENPAEIALAKHIAILNRAVDAGMYGHHAAKEAGGIFTSHGMLTENGDGELRPVYRGVQDLPAKYTEQNQSAPNALVMVQDTDLAELLLQIHALGGDYMENAKNNTRILANGGEDFFVMTDGKNLTITPADTIFRRDSEDWEKWMLAHDSPDVKAFFLSVTERDSGQICGDLFQTALGSVQNSLQKYGTFFTHFQAETMDGKKIPLSHEEWDTMGVAERGQIKNLERCYNSEDVARFEVHIRALRDCFAENRNPVTAEEFLAEINKQYMARANFPQSDMIRIAPDAAREMLGQGVADVRKLTQNGAEQLWPIAAAKTDFFTADHALAVKKEDFSGIEKWSERAANAMLRNIERTEHKKSHENTER